MARKKPIYGLHGEVVGYSDTTGQGSKPSRAVREQKKVVPRREPPTPPDQQDRRRTARRQNFQRGAAPTGGPGRAEVRRTSRVISKVERGKASVLDVQKELRRQGYDLAVDGVWGPQTAHAWKMHLQGLAQGQKEFGRTLYARQRDYTSKKDERGIPFFLSQAPNPRLELELFGGEGVKDLAKARARYQSLLAQQSKSPPPAPPSGDKGFLESIKEGAQRAAGVYEGVGRAVWDLEKFNVEHLIDMVKRDPATFAANPLIGFAQSKEGAELGAGPEIAKMMEGQDFNKKWALFEAALIPFRPLGVLKGTLRGGLAVRGGKKAIEEGFVKGYKSPSLVREYTVGKHIQRREAARTGFGRSMERLSDRLGNEAIRAGKEQRYSTKFRLDLMEVSPQVLRSFRSRLRRVGRRVDDKQEYALRIIAEGMTPAERVAHHVALAQKSNLPHLQLYHLQHAGLSEEASKFVQLNPEWTPGVDVREVPRIILRKDAPRHLHQAWSWFQETGALRESLLQELGRLSDESIMGRLSAPGRVIAGARYKKFEKAIQEEMDADPARKQAFEWIDQNIQDPSERDGLKTFYDFTIRSAAESTGKPISEILARVESVEMTKDLPPGIATLLQEGARHSDDDVRSFYNGIAKGLATHAGRPFNAKSAPRISALLLGLRERAIDAQAFRMWYSDSAKAILGHVGGNVEEAKKLAKLLAIFSPRARVWDESTWNNVTRAIGAYDEYKQTGLVSPKWSLSKRDTPKNRARKAYAEATGMDYKEPKRDWQTEEANDIMSGAGEWSGIKTNNFYRNFLSDIDPQEYAARFGEDTAVTIDTWMRRAFGYPRTGDKANETITDEMYDFMSQGTRAVAEDLGWQPKEAQAAIWTSIKAEMEGEPLDQAGFSFKDALEAYTKKQGQEKLFQREGGGRLHDLPEKGDPSPELQDLAKVYSDESGIPYNRPTDYVEVDEDRARRIAVEYERMIHDPENPQVKGSYDALISETFDQYFMLTRAGYRFEFPEGEYPYKSPWEAMADLRDNKHLYVFPTESGFGTLAEVSDHPLLADSGIEWGGRAVTHNDIFRAVHDVFGHHKEGVGFRASGEENAWRQHSAMYSELARGAMTTETRGQNSWVNFGPHGAANKTASETETVYADQKAGLLPKWIQNEGSGNDPYEAISSGPMAERLLKSESKDLVSGAENLLKENAPDLTMPQEARGFFKAEADVWTAITELHEAAPAELRTGLLKITDAIEAEDFRGARDIARNLTEGMSSEQEDLIFPSVRKLMDGLLTMGKLREGEGRLGKILPETDWKKLEARQKKAIEAGDFEEAQALHNLITGQGKQIPGVERRTTEGELFQRADETTEEYLARVAREKAAKGAEKADFDAAVEAEYQRLKSAGETKKMSHQQVRRLAHDNVMMKRAGLQRGGSLDIVSPYGIKGAVHFDLFDVAKIFMTPASDVTTLPHEMAHVMRRMMTPAQERAVAKAMGVKLTGPKGARNYLWDEKAEEKFAKVWEGMILHGLEPPGAKREFAALSKAFSEVLADAEVPNVPFHVAKTLRRMTEFTPRPGGKIMGAEDVLYGVEYAPTFRGMPFRPTQAHRQLSAYVKKASLALFGGGKRAAIGAGPDDPHLKKAYQGAALLSGGFKRDVIDPKADAATLAIRMSAASVARKALVDAGTEIPRFADDIAVKVDPRVDASKDLQVFWDKVSELGERKLDQKDLDGVNWDLIETARAQVLPPEVDGKPIAQVAQEIMDTERPIENIVWVPRDFVEASGLRYVPRAARYQERALKKWMRRSGMTWDVTNDLVKAQILWLNPAYAPVQFIGNTVMNLMHQGPYAAVSGWKSILMLREMELAERLTMDTAMGEGIGAAIRPSGAAFSTALDALHHYNSVASDVLPRRMAFLHEARRDGYKSLADVGALLKASRQGDEQAIQTLEQIARRARRSIVDFDRLSPFERDVVTRWIFFYPWLRAATDYSVNFVKDHPIQAAAIALMYEHYQAAQQDIIGDHPYYSNLDVPLATGTVGLKVPWTSVDISLSDAVGDKQWRDENNNPMVFKTRQALTQSTPLELAMSFESFSQGYKEGGLDVVSHLTPLPYAAGVALFGYDPYEGREVKPGPLTFLNQLGFPTSGDTKSTAPIVDRFKQIFLTTPEERAKANENALYPRQRRHHVLRVGLGSLAPTPYSTEIGQERARKLKPTLERKREELYLDAKEFGLEPPSKDVLRDLEVRTDLDSGWRRLSSKERAERVAKAYDQRYGTDKMTPFVSKLKSDAQAKEFYEALRPKIYPWLLAYERLIHAHEDAALSR